MATLTQNLKSYNIRQMINLNQTEYPHLQTTDLFRVMRHLPSCAVGGPWIAGGSVWRAVLNHPLEKCDIDMFFASKQQFESTTRQMSGYPFVRNILQETKNKWNITYKVHVNHGNFNKTIDVQLINMSYYRNLDELLNSFDFTVCQFGWDGQNLIANQTSVADLNDKKITLWRVGNPKSLFKHLIKYMDNGFTFSSTETRKLLNNVLAANPWNTKNSKDYDEPLEKPETEWEGYAMPQRNTARVDGGRIVQTEGDTQWYTAQPTTFYATTAGYTQMPGIAAGNTPEMVEPAPETFARPEPAPRETALQEIIDRYQAPPPAELNIGCGGQATPMTPAELNQPYEPLTDRRTVAQRELQEEANILRNTLEREDREAGDVPYHGEPAVDEAFGRIFANTLRRNNTLNRYRGPIEQRPPRGPARFDEDRTNPNLREAFDTFLNPPPQNNNGQENNQQERR